MINRVLIRIKVLQIVYSFYQNESGDLKIAEKELRFSLRKSYDLYHYFLLLILDLTYLYERIIDSRRHKLLPTAEDINPNTKLLENRFTKQLAGNKMLEQYVKENGISWVNDQDFLKNILDDLLKSEIYKDYINSDDNSYGAGKEFWRAFFKKHICGNESIEEYLEDKCIYWNDDIEIIQTFTLKTIKRFNPVNGDGQPLLPMFKDSDDEDFAIRLFRQSLLKGEEYRERLNRHSNNWETERIAYMDLIVMQVALAEIMTFPSIPISVSLNEYIDIAKYYSTPKSGLFINGILDSVVGELKKEKLLYKD